jgi:hypothetical protein
VKVCASIGIVEAGDIDVVWGRSGVVEGPIGGVGGVEASCGGVEGPSGSVEVPSGGVGGRDRGVELLSSSAVGASSSSRVVDILQG